tara:strand:- start:183 stop:782 length:600 start_codon:yes stop_codon:yes gene_type:complete
MSACAYQPDGTTAFVLLAAGKAARFGGGKLTSNLDGKPLWRWAADSAVAAGFPQLHIVTNDPLIADAHWTTHSNPEAEEGIASSIRIAAEIASSCTRLMIALADMPFVEPAHLRALAAADDAAFTRYPNGRDGVPAAFPQSALPKLLKLTGNRGATAIDWPQSTSIEPPSPTSLYDVDTPDDLARAQDIALRRRPASRR